MKEREKENINRNPSPLNEEELDQVTGGGFCYPVSGCPFGHTKIVKGVLKDGRHRECELR